MHGLIIGGKGYVGNGINNVLKKAGLNPISTTRKNEPSENFLNLDFNDNKDKINLFLSSNFIKEYFNYVVIASGYTEYIEKENMGKINDDLILKIIEANFLLIYRSLSIINANKVFASNCKIIVISSTAGIYAKGSNVIYSAMKSAVNNLVKSSSQWMRKDQKVLSLCPGLLEGGMTSGAPNSYKEYWKNIYKTGKLPDDLDIGEKVKELLLDKEIKSGSIIEFKT